MKVIHVLYTAKDLPAGRYQLVMMNRDGEKGIQYWKAQPLPTEEKEDP